MSTDIDFSLLENALDFVSSAAINAKDDTPRSLKYAILHLSAGVELLLKARLEKEHWSLLFADVDKAHPRALSSGAFKSVDFETACRRLDGIAGVSLSKVAFRHLDELRKIRNQAQHFAITIDIDSVRSLVAMGHNFVLDFVSENLGDAVEPFRETIEGIRVELSELQIFIDARLASLASQLKSATRLHDCPSCWQRTLTIDNEIPHCLFCDHKTDLETVAEYKSETGEVLICPTCDALACTLVVFNNDDAGWYCVACDTRGDYFQCPRCGTGLVDGDSGVCSSCWNDVINKDG